MTTDYKHSVSLDINKCMGCTTCLKRCPTEAIRIRDGHAIIRSDRCIDCGECIRVCPYNAKKATNDSLDCLREHKYNVALPAPSLYGQFNNMDDIGRILRGLLDIGFDEVYEVARAAELVSAHTRSYLKRPNVTKPVISSACPAIVRIISMNYPSLADRVMPILPPVDIAACHAFKKVRDEHPELAPDDIGIIFISPCPAKVSYVKNNFAGERNYITNTVSIRDVYFALLEAMKKQSGDLSEMTESGMIGIGWASTGGESTAVFNERYLAADGIENCIRVLDRIDNSEITSVDFIELNACSGGCVGGVMTVANPYIAQARLQSLKRYLPVSPNRPVGDWIPDEYFNEYKVEYTPAAQLSEDRHTAMRMMGEIEKITKSLPMIDCGSCGAPTCTAFAEDIVKGETNADECTVIMRALFHEYLEQHKDQSVLNKLQQLGKSEVAGASDTEDSRHDTGKSHGSTFSEGCLRRREKKL